MAALGHKNICRFDVPMDDSFRVRCVESVRYLDAQVKESFHFHRLTTDAVLERHAVQKFHDDESLPFSSPIS